MSGLSVQGSSPSTPAFYRTKSVASAAGPHPAAPLKRNASLASDEDLVSAAGLNLDARDLQPDFDAVADDLLAADAAGEASTAATATDGQDDNSSQSHSLSRSVEQTPVADNALPDASLSARAKHALVVDQLQQSEIGEKELRSEPQPVFAAPDASAESKRPSTPSLPTETLQPATPDNTIPSKETVLGMMSGATLPQDEAERLRTVALLGILDQPEDPVLSSITKLVARLLKVSTVGVNIIDRDRLWWPSISSSGPIPQWGWTHPRQIGFCAYTLLSEAAEVLVVEDASKDQRFKDSPFVAGFPHIRFYGGAPLIASNGHRIGALCAIDQEPRKLSTQQLSILSNLAEMVVRRIERDKQILLQQHSRTALLRTLRNQQEAVFMCDTAMSGWPILFTNKSCQDMLDWDEGTLGGRGVWDVFKIDPGCKDDAQQALGRRSRFTITASATKYPTHAKRLQLEFRPANQPTAIHPSLQIGIPAFISDKDDMFQLYFVTVSPLPQVLTAPAKLQASARPISGNLAVERPSDAWAKHNSAPGYASFPSDIRHTKTRQALAKQGATLKPTLDAFEEVQVGVLLGGSSSGNVYRGMWRSIPVAVKKTRARLADCIPMGEDDSLITQEAAVAVRVTHPHIVTTYKYAIKYSEKQSQQPRASMDRAGGSRPSQDSPQPQVSVDQQGRISFDRRSSIADKRASGDIRASEEKARVYGDSGRASTSGMAECWLFMELCNKGTLQHAINNGWLLDGRGAVNLVALLSSAREASLGMAQLHRENIIHGALTLAACFLKAARNQRGFVVKVGDLGRSSLNSVGTKLEVRRAVRYISPESICSGFTSKEFDVYSFGIMLYEMYTSAPAFASMSAGDIISAKLQNDHIVALPSTAPQALQDLVTRCVSHDPKARPSFPEISEALMNMRDSIAAGQTSSTAPLQSGSEAAPSQQEGGVSIQREGSVPITRQGMRSLGLGQSNAPAPKPHDSPRDRIAANWGVASLTQRAGKGKAERGDGAQRDDSAVMPAEGATIAGPDEVGNVQEQGQRSARVKNPCVPQFWNKDNLCSCGGGSIRTKSFMDEPKASDRDVSSQAASGSSGKSALRVKNFCIENSRNVLLLCR